MSPEQSEGRLDRLGPTSDIYSLGAILYTILTGKPPFERGDLSDMLERVRHGRFRRPRQIDRGIPRALEGICLKAMALRPEDRYQTAAALVSDIEHWLADEPVSAYRETPAERAGRWMRRHRTWTLAAAAAFVLVTVVSVAAALWVNDALQREQVARRDGMLRFRKARTAVDTWLTGAADTLKYYPGVQEARKRLLEKSAEDYEWLANQVSTDRQQEIERGRAYLRLGDVRHILGELPRAQEAYRSARLLFEDLARQHGDMLDCRLELANSHTKLGIVLTDGSDYEEAEESFLAAIAGLRDLPPDDSHDPRVCDSLGTCLLNRGSLLIATDRLDEAKQALQQSAGEFERVLKTEAVKPRHREGLATAQDPIGPDSRRRRAPQEGLIEIQRAIQSFNDLIQQESSHPERWNARAKTRICLADALRRMGRESEELEAYRDAIFDYQELSRKLPDVPDFQENFALTRTDFAQLLHQLGRNVDAEQELNQALSVFTDLVDRFPDVPRLREESAACLDTLARAISDLGRSEEASQICRSAVDVYQTLVLEYPDEPHYRQRGAISQSHLGRILHKLGDHEQAADALQAAIAALEEVRREAPRFLPMPTTWHSCTSTSGSFVWRRGSRRKPKRRLLGGKRSGTAPWMTHPHRSFSTTWPGRWSTAPIRGAAIRRKGFARHAAQATRPPRTPPIWPRWAPPTTAPATPKRPSRRCCGPSSSAKGNRRCATGCSWQWLKGKRARPTKRWRTSALGSSGWTPTVRTTSS